MKRIKILGLGDPEKWPETVAGIAPGLKWVKGPKCEKGLTGKVVWDVTAAVENPKPCWHVIYAVLQKAFAKGARTVYAEKKKHIVYTSAYFLEQKLKSVACQCGGIDGPYIPKKLMEEEVYPVWECPVESCGSKNCHEPSCTCHDDCIDNDADSEEHFEDDSKPGFLISVQPIQAEPVLGGETTRITDLESERDVGAATAGLYVLFELEQALTEKVGRIIRDVIPKEVNWGRALYAQQLRKERPHASTNQISDTVDLKIYCEWLKGREKLKELGWIRDLYSFKHEYETRLARNFFDYLCLASAGEARHCRNVKWEDGRPNSRHDASKTAIQYDPRHLLPVLEQVFEDGKFPGSNYGGTKWATVVRSATHYFTLSAQPMVFADHCVDLTHNGGLAYDKGYIFKNPSNKRSYLEMLDVKREGPLLASRCEVYLPEPTEGSISVGNLLRRAESLGIIPKSTMKVVGYKPDPKVKTLTWGTKPFKLEWKGAFAPARPTTEQLNARGQRRIIRATDA